MIWMMDLGTREERMIMMVGQDGRQTINKTKAQLKKSGALPQMLTKSTKLLMTK